MGEPADGELVPTNLSCVACKQPSTVCLVAEEPIRSALAGLQCPNCKSLGVMRLARPLFPDPRSPASSKPDELDDDVIRNHQLSVRNFPR